MILYGIYLGIVENAADPEHIGRLKIRVPAVYGNIGSPVGAIGVDDLPWALPMGLPAGGSNASGGLSMLPVAGDQVAVQFLDNDPDKPVWQWLMQTRGQAKNLKLHQYAEKQEKGQTVTGDPARAILTRYGHSLEITRDQVTLTTAEGYQVAFGPSQGESGGAAMIRTPRGQFIELRDLTGDIVTQALENNVISGKQVSVNAATSAIVKTTRFTLAVGDTMFMVQDGFISLLTASGATVLVDSDGHISLGSKAGAVLSLEDDKVQLGQSQGIGLILEPGKISVNAPSMVINTSAMSVGTMDGYPVLLLTPAMSEWLMGHVHEVLEGVTGPPTPPIVPEEVISTRLQTS
jgi:hypothetical protein